MLYKIYISSEASLKNVHPMQIFPVHIIDCNLPTHQPEGLGKKSPQCEQMLCIYLEILCFVKYDVPTEYLTLFSWFAVLVN